MATKQEALKSSAQNRNSVNIMPIKLVQRKSEEKSKSMETKVDELHNMMKVVINKLNRLELIESV